MLRDESTSPRRWAVWRGVTGRWCAQDVQPLVTYQERHILVMPVSEHEEAMAEWKGFHESAMEAGQRELVARHREASRAEKLEAELERLREAVRAFLEHADAPCASEEWEFLDLVPLRAALNESEENDG